MKLVIAMQSDLNQMQSSFSKHGAMDVEYGTTALSDLINHYTGVPCIIDKLLIREDAIDNPISDNLRKLKELLFSPNSMFKVTEVYFLLKTDSQITPYVEYFFEEYKNIVSIHHMDSYNFRTTSQIISGTYSLKQNAVQIEEEELIQQKIGVTDSTIFNNSPTNKSVLVVDNPARINSFMNKLDTQLKLCDLEGNTQISPVPIEPRNLRMELENKAIIQVIDEPDLSTTQSTTLIAVTGEKGTGKSVLALNLANSYSLTGKTLLVDACLHNMGVSSLCEDVKLPNAKVLYISELLNGSTLDTVRLINRLSTLSEPLIVLALDIDFLNKIPSENVYSGILEILLINLRKDFFKIIVDIPLAKYQQYSYVFYNSDYTILTFYRSLNSTYSLGKYLRDINIHLQWYKLIFVPTDAYNTLSNVTIPIAEELKAILEIFVENPVIMLRCIRFSGISQKLELSQMLDLVLSKLPKEEIVHRQVSDCKISDEDTKDSSETDLILSATELIIQTKQLLNRPSDEMQNLLEKNKLGENVKLTLNPI